VAVVGKIGFVDLGLWIDLLEPMVMQCKAVDLCAEKLYDSKASLLFFVIFLVLD
jgi:hypothetical protein